MTDLKQQMIKDLKLNGKTEMANYLTQVHTPEIDTIIDDVFKGQRYFVVCTTYNHIFLSLPFKEFYEKHSFPDPDKWFFKAGIHFAENPTHKVYAYSGKPTAYANSMDISGSLAVGCQQNNVSMRQLKDAYKIELKKAENKPI
jgi:hypothetical protein